MEYPKWVENDRPVNKIVLGDCINGLKAMDNDSVNLIVTDPPYGVNFQSNMRVKSEKFDYLENDANLDFLDPFVQESFRILKPNSHFYCFTRWDVYPQFYNIISKYFNVKNCLILKKDFPSMGDLRYSFSTNYEMCIFAQKGQREFNETKYLRGVEGHYLKRFNSVIDFIRPTFRGVAMIHPTQKSEDICRFFISISSNENELVLDPFSGSSTTLIAAKQLNRNYLGFEISPLYYKLSKERLSQQMLKRG